MYMLRRNNFEQEDAREERQRQPVRTSTSPSTSHSSRDRYPSGEKNHRYETPPRHDMYDFSHGTRYNPSQNDSRDAGRDGRRDNWQNRDRVAPTTTMTHPGGPHPYLPSHHRRDENPTHDSYNHYHHKHHHARRPWAPINYVRPVEHYLPWWYYQSDEPIQKICPVNSSRCTFDDDCSNYDQLCDRGCCNNYWNVQPTTTAGKWY